MEAAKVTLIRRVGELVIPLGSSRTVLGDINYIYRIKMFILLDWAIPVSVDRIIIAQNGCNNPTRFPSFLDCRNNTFRCKLYYKMELSCLVLRNLVFLHCFFTVAIDLDGTLGRSQYNIRCFVELKLFVKDIERFVILISILLYYAVGLPNLAIGTLSTSTPE